MLEFLQDNVILILSVLGVALSFLGSFIALVAKKKPIVFLAVIAVAGFAVSVGYQLYNHNLAQMDKVAKLARENIIDEINLTVNKTSITVDAIAEKLLSTKVGDVGTQLVSVQSDERVHFEESSAFAKGSAEMWRQYANWLDSLSATKVAPSLRLRLNAGHHYDGGLLLAYLLTSQATFDQVSVVVGNQGWQETNPEDVFFQAFNNDTNHIETLLVYQGDSEIPVAFASAREFIQELMIYYRLDPQSAAIELLNDRSPNTLDKLVEAFPSLKKDIYNTAQPSELVKSMIEQQQAIAISAQDKKIYVVRLEKMVQLAARE